MKALVFDPSSHEWETSRGFELCDIVVPVLDESRDPADANQVIIKMQYAGVCGTDRGIWTRSAFRDQILKSIKAQSNTYRILGHELFGEVTACGSHVKNVTVGDKITCESHAVCNECYQCLRGEHNVCTNEKILGISTDGGFAEYIKVPAHIVWKTDTTKIRPEIAVMQEPFGNAVHAASKTDFNGKIIAIFGLGSIGLFLTLIARAMGAKKIIGIDPNPRACDMARQLGIDEVIVLESTNEVGHNKEAIGHIMKMTGNTGADVSYEMAGFNDSINNCIASTRRGGAIILFGIKNGDVVIEDYNRVIVQGYTIHCVIGRRLWETWETTRRLLEDTHNGIQEKIFNVIINKGDGTIMPIAQYTKEVFEKKMATHSKILIKF